MKCPECDTLISDDKRGPFHCAECRTDLVLTDHGVRVKVAPKHYKGETDMKLTKRIRFTPVGEPSYTEKCNFCHTPTNKMIGVRGNVITTFIKRLVMNEEGELVEKMVPQFKEVLSCTGCMGSLNEVLPDKVVNPIEERFRKGRNEIRRIVNDVTYDTNKADVIDTTPCTTYVDLNGKCLYCKGSEVDHEIHFLGRTVRLERYNVLR